MDVLSDVISVMRTGRPNAARVQRRGVWGQRFPAVPGAAGFQVILRGSCWLIPQEDDTGAAPVPLSAGDVVFFSQGHPYGLADSPATPLAVTACDPTAEDLALFVNDSAGPDTPDGGEAATVTLCGGYRLDPRRTHPLLHDLPGLIHIPTRATSMTGDGPEAAADATAELGAVVAILGREIATPRPGTDAVVPALLDMLLLYILRAWFDGQLARGAATGWAAALSDPAVSTALHAAHQDPARPWTVESLGREAGMSRAAFAARFTALVGQPPLTYLTWWRMTTAARLLRDSDAGLAEIAARVGYSSEYAFGAAFKRVYGTAPGLYRRRSSPSG
ncbi:AraC family transcriptional regulator [Microbispora amethystogenes]|uniref:AraC family transcriptional regulator n=1 Tax=Microbispora amethystogenes TaxID=1427754 RepID=A0ABQ4F9G7_9ACTN|nr:AraC family transcriptional regulator [Microbispora amethystogenes]GIH31466.1 AraC family transcriptional regulator [Microbispora amethystogenes]